MGGIVLMITGVIFIGVGLFASGFVNNILLSIGAISDTIYTMDQIPFGIGPVLLVIFVGIGVVIFFFGLVSFRRARGLFRQHQMILTNGVQTEGRVTFVDRNYNFTINERPVFSIVEYTYTDGSGVQRTNRLDQMNTESVIRSGIQVGSTIQVKYLMDDPSQSTIVPISLPR